MAEIKTIFITALCLVFCAALPAQNITTYANVRMDSAIVADAEMNRLIALYADSMSNEMGRVIGTSATTMVANRPESDLMRLLSDILFDRMAKYSKEQFGFPYPDMALANVGGMRAKLIEGEITIGNIFEISPFDNCMVIVEMNGLTLQKMMKHVVDRSGEALSHAKINIIDEHLTYVTVNGKFIDPNMTYYVATLDYIAEGGDNFSDLKGQRMFDTGIVFHDAIISYVKEKTSAGEKIVAPTDERIKVLGEYHAPY